jgi:hypothetical protein
MFGTKLHFGNVMLFHIHLYINCLIMKILPTSTPVDDLCDTKKLACELVLFIPIGAVDGIKFNHSNLKISLDILYT